MAAGRRKVKNPCQRCGLNTLLCICSQIPRLDLKTRLLLVIHAREVEKTTNTGKLALEALPNSEMRVRGETAEPVDLTDALDPVYQPLLFYPSENAHELTPELMKSFDRPILLIVPDGNWRQASKVHTRHQELSEVPRVMIKTPNLATEHLRAEHTSYGMSTIEAIAKALGVIEGSVAEEALTALYQAKLHNTLRGRAGMRKGGVY